MLGGPTEVEVYHAPYKEWVTQPREYIATDRRAQLLISHRRGPGMEEAILYPLPPPSDVVPRRLTDAETARVDLLCRLLFVCHGGTAAC